MHEDTFQKWIALASAAQAVGQHIVLSGEMLSVLLDDIRHGDAADPCAPRQDADGSPCWCNGPCRAEEHHHAWCRARRKAWLEFLRICALDIDAFSQDTI